MVEPASVIITRAEPGASETAERLAELGYHSILSPMLSLKATAPAPSMPLETAGGLIFTSANGVRYFAETSERRDVSAWCVGPATETAARQSGFTDIHTANGNAEDLRAFIAERAYPSGGHLLHIANRDAAGNLAAGLREDGFNVTFIPLYETVPAKRFSDAAEASLAAQSAGAILIHSAKGAAAVSAALGDTATAHIRLVAVSQNAAAPLMARSWNRVAIAERPNEDALIAALRDSI